MGIEMQEQMNEEQEQENKEQCILILDNYLEKLGMHNKKMIKIVRK